jgi:hypothetical protein
MWSTGSMLPSTSIASLPDVAGNPKHIDNPFLWIASNYTPPPPQAKFGGYIGITLSVRPSVRPSGYIYMDCPEAIQRKGLSIRLGLPATSGREAMEVEGNILPVDL